MPVTGNTQNYEVTISYNQGIITGTSATGSITLETEDKFCDGDITITYNRPNTGTGTPGTATSPATISGDNAIISYDDTNNTLTLEQTISVTPEVTAGYISTGTAGNSTVSLTADMNINDSSDLSASGATVTAPAGYYPTQVSKSIALGSATTPSTTITVNPTISVDSTGLITASNSASQNITPTIAAGYVSTGSSGTITVSGSSTNPLETQSAQIIHPSLAVDQTINEGLYLTGNQVIKGVTTTNLTAENIKSGVTVKIGDSTDDDCVTSIEGTYTGGSGSNITISPLNVTSNNTYTAPAGTAYSPVVVNVPTGGIVEVEELDVNFIDYDGTILYSYTASEFLELVDMPEDPYHEDEGLIAQGWNWTLEEAQDYVSNYGKLWIGQMYDTDTGDTRIFIRLTDENNLEPTLSFNIKGTATIDWGDDSELTTASGNNLSTTKNFSHQYSSIGDYIITISMTSNTLNDGIAFTGTSNGTKVLWNQEGQSYSSICYQRAIYHIQIGSNVKKINNYAFYHCVNLQTITLPNGDMLFGGSSVFRGCYELKSITIPTGEEILYQTFFNNCNKLQKISLPPTLITIQAQVFYETKLLQSITIPDNVTSLGTYCFSESAGLKQVTLPNSINSIGGGVFDTNYLLEFINLPLNNENFTTIPNSTFFDCYSLTSIKIPESVDTIGDDAFCQCYSLSSIYFESETPPTIEENTFYRLSPNCIFYVPVGSLEDYQNAENYPSNVEYREYTENSFPIIIPPNPSNPSV